MILTFIITFLHYPGSDEEEQLWVWEYGTEEGTHDLFMDIGEEIRFRVLDETFTDITPAGPEKGSQDIQANQEVELKKPPYVITVSKTESIPFPKLGPSNSCMTVQLPDKECNAHNSNVP